MHPRQITAIALSSLALAGFAACGEDDESEPAAGGTETTETVSPTETSGTETEPAEATEISTNLDEKPSIPKPTGEPPTELKVEDVVEGKGTAAKAGDQITVRYVGVSFSTGEEFDASWDRGEDLPFQLGGGQVIPGWDQGLEGMKEGGRRMLTIPPDLAYGPSGQPPAIGPNETLIFVVDLVSIG